MAHNYKQALVFPNLYILSFNRSWLSADNKDDKLAWMETLNRQLSDSKAWSATKQRVKMHIGKDVAESSHQRNRSTVAV